jgi:hypothetical protein
MDTKHPEDSFRRSAGSADWVALGVGLATLGTAQAQDAAT